MVSYRRPLPQRCPPPGKAGCLDVSSVCRNRQVHLFQLILTAWPHLTVEIVDERII
jgi:hypothetical protein